MKIKVGEYEVLDSGTIITTSEEDLVSFEFESLIMTFRFLSDDSEKLSVNFDVTDKSNAVLSFYNFNSQLTIGNSEPLVLGTYHDKELSLLVRLSRLEKGGRTINYTWLLKELSND